MREEFIKKNPMNAVPTIKKSNYLAKQNKEVLPVCETITVFTDEEIEKFKAEAYKKYPSGKPKHNQASAYILMLNTGLRTAEALGLINSDIDLEKKVMHIQRGVKEAQKRDGTERKSGREIVVGKLKTASSKRIVPLNEKAVQAIIELRNERYFGEDAPLIPDADGNFTRPLNLRKRFYSILDAAGIKKKGLHSLRHTFATKLVTGVRGEDGTVKALTPRQVADLLGHTTSEITEMYYVKRNTDMLMGVTNGFEL